MEEYEKRQTESLERMANRSAPIKARATEVLDDDEPKELESKNGFWVYDRQGKPLMKLKEDKKPMKSIEENLDIDKVKDEGEEDKI